MCSRVGEGLVGVVYTGGWVPAPPGAARAGRRACSQPRPGPARRVHLDTQVVQLGSHYFYCTPNFAGLQPSFPCSHLARQPGHAKIKRQKKAPFIIYGGAICPPEKEPTDWCEESGWLAQLNMTIVSAGLELI